MVCGKLKGKMSMKSFSRNSLFLHRIIVQVFVSHSVVSEQNVVSMMFAMRPLRTFGVCFFPSLVLHPVLLAFRRWQTNSKICFHIESETTVSFVCLFTLWMRMCWRWKIYCLNVLMSGWSKALMLAFSWTKLLCELLWKVESMQSNACIVHLCWMAETPLDNFIANIIIAPMSCVCILERKRVANDFFLPY